MRNTTYKYLALLLSPALLFGQTERLTIDDLLGAARLGRGVEGLLSPDGKYFATQERGQIAVKPVEDGPVKVITHSQDPKSELQWSTMVDASPISAKAMYGLSM